MNWTSFVEGFASASLTYLVSSCAAAVWCRRRGRRMRARAAGACGAAPGAPAGEELARFVVPDQ